MSLKNFIGSTILLSSSLTPFQVSGSFQKTQELERQPDHVVRNGQYLVSDLDSTLIYTFNGTYEPGLEESPCKEPLLNWLKLGGRIIAVTGNDLSRNLKRFYFHIPRELRENNQVILIANGGSVIYGTDAAGNLVEDIEYREMGLAGKSTAMDPDQVNQLVEGGKDTINAFFREIRGNPELTDLLLEKYLFLVKIAVNHPEDFTLEELLTHDTLVVPRIEKRCRVDDSLQPDLRCVTQVAIIGIPEFLNYPMDNLVSSNEASCALAIKKGNLTTEINLEGLDKAVPLLWMIDSDQYDFIPELSFSIGDRPHGNDGPMMRLQDSHGMPFISVAEEKGNLPENVAHIGGLCEGTTKILQKLCDKTVEISQQGEFLPVIPTKLNEIIGEIYGDISPVSAERM